jgi:hypothetical protein
MIRHPWVHHFLETHIADFDRVFLFDAFDCYFHRDPFEVLNFDEMVFFEEGWALKNAGMNKRWIQTCFNNSLFLTIQDFPTVCSGTIYGSARIFLQFEQLLQQHRWWEHCTLDQPIINVLIATGEFQAADVPFRLLSCTSAVLTLSNCSRTIKEVNGVKEVFNGDGVVPHVVHQWKSFLAFAKLYVQRCDMSEYISRYQMMDRQNLNWSMPQRQFPVDSLE